MMQCWRWISWVSIPWSMNTPTSALTTYSWRTFEAVAMLLRTLFSVSSGASAHHSYSNYSLVLSLQFSCVPGLCMITRINTLKLSFQKTEPLLRCQLNFSWGCESFLIRSHICGIMCGRLIPHPWNEISGCFTMYKITGKICQWVAGNAAESLDIK